jgi:hypothetical protein
VTLATHTVRVQNKAARFITKDYNWSSSVTEMKKQLKWHSLQERRFVNRQSLLYKSQTNMASLEIPEYFTETERNLRNGNASVTHYIPVQSSSNQYSYSFMPRTIRVWNLLPVQVASVLTADHFREGVWRLINTKQLVAVIPRGTVILGHAITGRPLSVY